MKVQVFDTHVRTKENKYYHFDVLVENASKDEVIVYVKEFLDSIGIQNANIKQKICEFCHVESAPLEVQKEIKKCNYYILKMEGF